MAQRMTKVDLYSALMRKCGFEVVQEKETAKQLRLMGRSPADRWTFFLPVVHRLLTLSGTPGNSWTCDISKQYMLRNDQVLYGWRLIFQVVSGDIADMYGSTIAAVNQALGPSRIELTSQLLPGYSPGDVRGGVNAKGKGVSSAGSLPMAVTGRRS